MEKDASARRERHHKMLLMDWSSPRDFRSIHSILYCGMPLTSCHPASCVSLQLFVLSTVASFTLWYATVQRAVSLGRRDAAGMTSRIDRREIPLRDLSERAPNLYPHEPPCSCRRVRSAPTAGSCVEISHEWVVSVRGGEGSSAISKMVWARALSSLLESLW